VTVSGSVRQQLQREKRVGTGRTVIDVCILHKHMVRSDRYGSILVTYCPTLRASRRAVGRMLFKQVKWSKSSVRYLTEDTPCEPQKWVRVVAVNSESFVHNAVWRMEEFRNKRERPLLNFLWQSPTLEHSWGLISGTAVHPAVAISLSLSQQSMSTSNNVCRSEQNGMQRIVPRCCIACAHHV